MKFILKIIINLFSTIIFIILVLLSIGGGITLYSKANAFLPLKQGYTPIKIYDNDNNLISTSSIYYSYVSLRDVSPNIINAFIAVEDRNFYSHNGYSVKGIIRASINNIKNKNYSSGASTITQQYVKNVYLNNEKTLKRKINEIAYAIELEKRYTKDQILEAYLNSILFGGNIYGINMASKYYFDKHPSDISISEAAYLAGLIQAPNKYNAYKNPIQANERKNTVLKCMYDCNFITLNEFEHEKAINIKDLLRHDSTAYKEEPYLSSYLDYVYSNISLSNDELKSVNTYLDKNLQYDLYELTRSNIFSNNNLNCSIIVLDNYNYSIKALIGNRISDRLVINYATDVLLQPGSTIKPILDYAPAIEYLSYTPATIINDEPYTYSNGTPIKNYDNIHKGNITLRMALRDSRNIPALKLYQAVGGENAFRFANNLNIYANDTYEANAIGGATTGYTLLNLANAYQAFANLGYYAQASAIKSLDYNHSTDIREINPRLVMKPTTAWLINNILHDVLKSSAYNIPNTYLMAKTGQTNYDDATAKKYNIPKNSTKDSLIIAYTKDLTIGVWVGFNTIEKNQYLTRQDKSIPKTIMNIVLSKYANKNEYYQMIDGIKKEYITIENNNAYLTNKNGYYEYFEDGTEPKTYLYPYDKA